MKKPDLYTAARQVFTVSKLTARIRSLFEENLGPVWVEGEVSGLRRPASGHMYLSLKDPEAQLRAAVFRNRLRYMAFRPEDGMHVLAFGRLDVYGPRGDYQLIIDHLEPLGAGALAVAFEQLKEKLDAEGLFDQGRKKSLPVFPQRVVLATSSDGAALWDILRTIRRRFLGLDIQIYPVPVQGESAPGLIAQALTDLGRLEPGPEVVILARGGGSPEDLWAFNTEPVARAIAACPIPIVSAVGHEVDYTIADFVADVRASTPTAAAELLVRPKREWLAETEGLQARLGQSLGRRLETVRLGLAGLEGRLIDPRRALNRWRLRLDDLMERLARARKNQAGREADSLGWLTRRLITASPQATLATIEGRRTALTEALIWRSRVHLQRARTRTATTAKRLDSVSPLATLSRGYSLTLSPDGRLIRSAEELEVGQRVSIRLAQGRLGCLVEKIYHERESRKHAQKKEPV